MGCSAPERNWQHALIQAYDRDLMNADEGAVLFEMTLLGLTWFFRRTAVVHQAPGPF